MDHTTPAPVESTDPKSPADARRARVQRYRAKHKRIDYVPSAKALAIIRALMERSTDKCLAGTIDQLILLGDRAISGNGWRRG